MKTFETYLQEQCPSEYATNNSPEGFERWLEQLDVQEVMDMAEVYVAEIEREMIKSVREELTEYWVNKHQDDLRLQKVLTLSSLQSKPLTNKDI